VPEKLLFMQASPTEFKHVLLHQEFTRKGTQSGNESAALVFDSTRFTVREKKQNLKENLIHAGPQKSVRPTGFEPVTCGLEVRCSIQLSYGRIVYGLQILPLSGNIFFFNSGMNSTPIHC